MVDNKNNFCNFKSFLVNGAKFMEQFDLNQGLKKYLKEGQVVIPLMSLAIVATFVCFAVVLLFWVTSMELSTPIVLLCVFALLSVILFLRYRKNAKHYYFFGYVDAFPDMDAPLNVLALENYYGRLKLRAMEEGFDEVDIAFTKTRQVYHLDFRAKAPNGNLLSISFETQSVTFADLSTGATRTVEYSAIVDGDKGGDLQLDVITACLSYADSFSRTPPQEEED